MEPGSTRIKVSASGSRSKLRRACSHAEEPRPLPYGAFWASLAWRGEGFEESALLQRYDRASVMIGVLPIGRPIGTLWMVGLISSITCHDTTSVHSVGP